jgi:patatin-like phospholipase/acyl hydrolase
MTTLCQDDPVNLLALGKNFCDSLHFQDTENMADGGGVRGVSELMILNEIMHKIKERDNLDQLPKPCDYFNLIAGTSTGG